MRADASLAELHAIGLDVEELPRWWPAAFLAVELAEPAGASPLEALYRVHAKGWLPFSFRFLCRVRQVSAHRLRLDVEGDFEGGCDVTVESAGERSRVELDWRVRVQKPIVRRFSWLCKPLFAANHRWVVARGEESLAIELARRRGAATGARWPLPPGPTFPHDRRSRRLLARVRSAVGRLAPRVHAAAR